MIKQVRQFYYTQDMLNDTVCLSLSSGDFCSNVFSKINQIGIQTLPGVQFYLNQTGELSIEGNPSIVGMTGIYELDVPAGSSVEQIRFDEESLKMLQKVSGSYLIIDIIGDEITGGSK